MSRRNIESQRTSIQQVAPQEGILDQSTMGAGIAAIGQDIIRTGQEAKITENFSKAQIDLNRLNTQYQIDYEHDPFNKDGLSKLRTEREKIFQTYGSEISPFFKRPWEQSTRELTLKDDAETEIWGYAQTKKNTIRSINKTIKNNMSQATVDGQNFGNSDTDELGSILNYAASKKNLMGFGDKRLGAGTTTELLEGYDDDYLKSFVGGVSETNPLKALRLLEKDEVKGSFRDQGQYLKMKDAIETRALQADKIFMQREVLNVLKDENSLLGKSLQGNVSYVELQKEFTSKKMSASAQDFFLKANGFRSEKGEEKLSKSEKLAAKVELYDQIQIASQKEDMTPEEISALQDKVYKAMDRTVIDEEEGTGYINQFITPLVTGKEQQLQKFQTGQYNPWQDNVGFSGLQDLIDQVTTTPPEIIGESSEAETSAISAVENSNNEKKLKLYNFYTDQLKQAANSRGIVIGDIPSLPSSEKQKIYSAAQVSAKKSFLADQYPELGNLKDDQWPDSIVTPDGRKIKTGVASAKVQGKVVALKPQYEFKTEAEMDAAGLADGTPVMVNGVSGFYRKPK